TGHPHALRPKGPRARRFLARVGDALDVCTGDAATPAASPGAAGRLRTTPCTSRRPAALNAPRADPAAQPASADAPAGSVPEAHPLAAPPADARPLARAARLVGPIQRLHPHSRPALAHPAEVRRGLASLRSEAAVGPPGRLLVSAAPGSTDKVS